MKRPFFADRAIIITFPLLYPFIPTGGMYTEFTTTASEKLRINER
jgi:hypothetical protein